MILKRIPDKLKKDIEQFHPSNSDSNEIWLLSADAGMSKTYATLSYCAENKDSLYFSFRHISAELAVKTFAERFPMYSRITQLGWRSPIAYKSLAKKNAQLSFLTM